MNTLTKFLSIHPSVQLALYGAFFTAVGAATTVGIAYSVSIPAGILLTLVLIVVGLIRATHVQGLKVTPLLYPTLGFMAPLSVVPVLQSASPWLTLAGSSLLVGALLWYVGVADWRSTPPLERRRYRDLY